MIYVMKINYCVESFIFFFQAEDGIRDKLVTGVQTCALPISGKLEFVGAVTDITAAKQSEEKLRRNEWNLLEAQRLGRSGSWSLDVSSGTVTNTPEIWRAFGLKPGEDCSHPDFWFNRIHPEDRKRVRDLFERCLVEKTDYEAEYRILLPDGTIKYQHAIGRPIVNGAGNLVEFVGT